MDIETAANIGEAISGVAILFTLLFSLRQMKYWNENRRYEIGRDLANHMNNPLIHRGFSVSTTKLHDNLTMQEMAALSREEKDAMNAMMIGMNNIGLLAKTATCRLIWSKRFVGVMSEFLEPAGDGLLRCFHQRACPRMMNPLKRYGVDCTG